MAEALGEQPERVAVATFVDKVLSTCWCIEESVAPGELAEAVRGCEEILKVCG